MKITTKFITLNALVLACIFRPSAFAQGTTFTYQGRLNDHGVPANGTNYGMVFYLYDAPTNGNLLGNLGIPSVTVSNGLFTTPLDFGNAFDGTPRWLEISVEKTGDSGFTTLSPRQQLTPAPYAIMANSASNLLGGLPAAQLSGTISASQLPDAVVTNNEAVVNLSGTFSGSYYGNAGGLTNVTGTLPWQVVAGATQQAQPNIGYVITNKALVTLTLPALPNIGDVTRISGNGLGGWKILQNANQFVFSQNLVGNIGSVWTPHANNGLLWTGVASSADGTKLVAAAGSTFIYTSTDSGVTWTARASTPFWHGVASSADGTKLVAVASSSQIYTSTDSGTNWTARDSSRGWWCAASSADGTKLVAAVNGGQIYTSTDSGATWTARASSQAWYSVASSTDGAKLVAVVNGGQIYTSADSGVTWTARESSRTWYGVASSADGGKLVATVSSGQIYTSVPISVQSTTSGTPGYLMGYQNCAIELQFLGSGQFQPISHEGLIQAF